jgi:hypothetical protein
MMYNAESMPLDPLIRRALIAYLRSDAEVQPTDTRVRTLKGKRYVVLRRSGKLLACYRVRNDGQLKRLVRLPGGID